LAQVRRSSPTCPSLQRVSFPAATMFARAVLMGFFGAAAATNRADGVYALKVQVYAMADCSGSPNTTDVEFPIGQCIPSSFRGGSAGQYEMASMNATHMSTRYYGDAGCQSALSVQESQTFPLEECNSADLLPAKVGQPPPRYPSGHSYRTLGLCQDCVVVWFALYSNSDCSGSMESAGIGGGFERCSEMSNQNGNPAGIYVDATISADGNTYARDVHTTADCSGTPLQTMVTYALNSCVDNSAGGSMPKWKVFAWTPPPVTTASGARGLMAPTFLLLVGYSASQWMP